MLGDTEITRTAHSWFLQIGKRWLVTTYQTDKMDILPEVHRGLPSPYHGTYMYSFIDHVGYGKVCSPLLGDCFVY